MQAFITVGTILVLFLIILLVDRSYENKKRQEWVKNHYGVNPDRACGNFELVSMYMETFGNRLPEDEMIDEVTWNDLEMDLIFDRINNCTTFAGEQLLYSRLHQLSKEQKDMQELDGQIAYYETHPDKREQVQMELCRLGREESSYYLPLFINNLKMLGISNIWFYRILQILLGVSVLAAVISGESAVLLAALVIFLFNAGVYGVKKAEHEIYMDTLGGMIRLVKVTGRLVRGKQQLVSEVPESVLLDLKLFGRMSRMIGMLQKKKQAALAGDILGLLRDYIIGATLWDFTSYHKIIHFLQGKEDQFMELYEFMGEIDMAISVASFRKSLPFYCTPEFSREKKLMMKELYHPLIQDAVCNSVTLDHHCMITGSNASGKSTFIKAVVINAILAQNIHTCTAKQFLLSEARIITSMAIRDDIMAGESYYIKEIKYLNRIIQSLDGGRLVICAIDEILKGTNTRERVAASAAVLNYLCKANCLALIASHDIELTRMLGEKFKYYYFSDQMSDEDVIFNYKIQKGVSNANNAIRLLDYIGFPGEIIQEARYNYSHSDNNGGNTGKGCAMQQIM